MYIISLIAIFGVCLFFMNHNKYQEISYSRLTDMILDKNIEKIEVKKNIIILTNKNIEKFSCRVDNTENLKQLIQNYNNQYEEKIELIYKNDNWGDIFIKWVMKNFLFVVFLLIFLYCFISLKFSDSEFGFSQKIFSGDKKIHKVDDLNKVFFDDIGGCEESKQILKEIVDFFKNKESYLAIGAVKPKGVLLYGAPGTGKTMLAKAVATEADCAFIYQSASSFDEMFVGLGASRIRELFAQAKKYGRCIIFIDELDALGSRSQKGIGNQSHLQTLNELLTQMDGFESNNDILVIAATNKKEHLDEALTRSGRFDKHVHVTLPDKFERIDIFQKTIKKRGIKIDPYYDLNKLSLLLNGTSGADIVNILNQAAMYAVREGDNIVEQKHIDYSLDQFFFGGIKNHDVSEEEVLSTARHEAGHTLVAYSFNSQNDIYKVTIVGRSRYLGALHSIPKDRKGSVYKIEYLNNIKCCLAGRIAEEIYYGNHNISSGAYSDLVQADNLIRSMVEKFGMFNSAFIDSNHGNISEAKKAEFDYLVEKLLNNLYQETKAFLLKNKKALDELSDTLYQKKTLTANNINDILEKYNLKNETLYTELKDIESVG